MESRRSEGSFAGVSLSPIRTTQLYEQVVSQIKDLIIDGKLLPGDQLPSERELSERLEVGRASVREALKILAIIGFVEISAGKGVFIRELEPRPYLESVSHSMELLLRMKKTTLFEIWEIRRILEVENAVLAARRRTEKDLIKMHSTIIEMKNHVREEEPYLQADTDFHISICDATHNKIMLMFMESLVHLIARACKQAIWDHPEFLAKSLISHDKIYRCIEEQNAEVARVAMIEHIEEARKSYGLEEIPR